VEEAWTEHRERRRGRIVRVEEKEKNLNMVGEVGDTLFLEGERI
jgi:hypothetical protein